MKVESRLRGNLAETVLVRRLGGIVGDCALREAGTNDSQFEIGERVLLFLTPENRTLAIRSGENVPYMVEDGPQGIWKIGANDAIRPTDEFNVITSPEGQSWKATAESILESLNSGSPPLDMPEQRIVPLDLAPVAKDVDSAIRESTEIP